MFSESFKVGEVFQGPNPSSRGYGCPNFLNVSNFIQQ